MVGALNPMSATCVLEAPAAAELRSEWIEDAAEFSRIGAEWRDLFRRANSPNVFLTFDWMNTWWKHFGKGRPAVIAVRDGSGSLVALAPFYVSRAPRALGARRLGFLADEYVGSDYLDMLAAPAHAQAAAAEIAGTLLERQQAWDYIELRDTHDSALAAALARRLNGDALDRRVCHYIPLPSTFDKYLATLSTSLRCNYRRRWKILQKEHQGECLILSSAADIERHFPSLLALHRMRFERRAAESAFLAPGVPEFHREAARALAGEGQARLLLLRAGGESVAAIYGFPAGQTFQFYQCGMHPDWMRQGVGQVLIGNAIEHAIAAGHHTFDFLRGDESYKTQWSDVSRETVTLRFFDDRPGSARARLGLGAVAALRGAAKGAKADLVAIRQRFLRDSPDGGS